MIKHFCDECHKEINECHTYRYVITIKSYSIGNWREESGPYLDHKDFCSKVCMYGFLLKKLEKDTNNENK